jgi:glycosyltransferase involved in cell wall biosynthesis
LIAPASRDGLPFPIVEAIVNGVPVVGANVPGIADTLRPFTGWIVDDDAAGIASGVLEAWADIDAVWLAAQAQRAEAGAFYSPERRREHLLSTYARLSDTEVGASPISR